MLDVIIVVSYVMLPIILGGIFAIIKIKLFSSKAKWNIGYFFVCCFQNVYMYLILNTIMFLWVRG